MPLTTGELLRLACIDKRTLYVWKRRYGVQNARRGWWQVEEISRLERAVAVNIKSQRSKR
jgi:hypothetical protein